jgi:hypothetical protein
LVDASDHLREKRVNTNLALACADLVQPHVIPSIAEVDRDAEPRSQFRPRVRLAHGDRFAVDVTVPVRRTPASKQSGFGSRDEFLERGGCAVLNQGFVERRTDDRPERR